LNIYRCIIYTYRYQYILYSYVWSRSGKWVLLG